MKAEPVEKPLESVEKEKVEKKQEKAGTKTVGSSGSGGSGFFAPRPTKKKTSKEGTESEREVEAPKEKSKTNEAAPKVGGSVGTYGYHGVTELCCREASSASPSSRRTLKLNWKPLLHPAQPRRPHQKKAKINSNTLSRAILSCLMMTMMTSRSRNRGREERELAR